MQNNQVRFVAQGGKVYTGTATGRLGSQLRIRYQIQSGEVRERWFPKSRQVEVPEDLDVPVFKNRTCKALRFETPILGVKRSTGPHDYITEYPGAPTQCPGCGRKVGSGGDAARRLVECRDANGQATGWHKHDHQVMIGIASHKEIVPA
jgi:hypothetical protein